METMEARLSAKKAGRGSDLLSAVHGFRRVAKENVRKGAANVIPRESGRIADIGGFLRYYNGHCRHSRNGR
jgi:hypothetical protein